ncbi:50S ribosomal protein L9 [Sneathiella sp.]|uniref:50S ribosomal protein L9 n=1 Tax=Sneathiella sp. TaxID=1964365 RepID=UPI002FE32D52
MEVILLERVEKLGQMGDVVKVRDGYARNFLLPQKKALRASKENLSMFESQRAQLEAENLNRREEATKVGEKLDGQTVVVIRAASDSQQLYGSVSTQDIAKAITAAGFTVNRKQVILDKVLKTLGLHDIRVRLHPEVTVSVTVNIARSPEEAEIQARGESVAEVAEAKLDARDEAVVNVFESTADADEEDAG